MKGHAGAVRSVDFSSDSKHLITASDDKTVKVHRPSQLHSIYAVTYFQTDLFSLTLSFFSLILSYLILSYLILSYLILSYLILSYLILSYLILSYLILSYLSSLIFSYLLFSYPILFYSFYSIDRCGRCLRGSSPHPLSVTVIGSGVLHLITVSN